DKIMAICADEMIQAGTLRKNTIVATVMSNMALETFIRQKRGRLIRTQVGDRYVVEEMRKRGYNFGGEKSGHIVFIDHTTTGDGTLAALQVLAIMRRREKNLSDLAKIIDPFPQLLVNVRVKVKKPFGSIPRLNEMLNSFERTLEGRGRINLRYSGTEALARVMVEGENEVLIKEIAEEIAGVIEQDIGERVSA
ncbi:MAG: phosphoglucosamine mutase, partial [Thermodesulfobacteriota bacterium]